MTNTMILTLAVLALAGAPQSPRSSTTSPTIVFVCEHGAAKSVIAAAYFNKLAAERHLNFHAIARGTKPQADISRAVTKGLRADGVAFEKERPRLLTDADAAGAVRIVAF